MASDEKYFGGFEEFVTMLLQKHEIHEGIWGLAVEFRFAAGNLGQLPNVRPTAMVGINRIGIQKFEQESEIAFDAARLNPRTNVRRAGLKGRDAVHGRFVPAKRSRQNAKTSTVERIPKPGYGDTK